MVIAGIVIGAPMVRMAISIPRSLTIPLRRAAISGSAISRGAVAWMHGAVMPMLIDMGHAVLTLNDCSAVFTVPINEYCRIAVFDCVPE